MTIDSSTVTHIHILFDAGALVPPPYHFSYTLAIAMDKEPAVKYSIQYLHREELTEEEILDEGFTMNDDWKTEVKLPAIWNSAILEQLKKSSWPNKPKIPQAEESVLEIELKDADQQTLFKGRPAEPDSWEYFLQELIQAVYEVAQKEAPLFIHYKEIERDKKIDIEIAASFAQLNAEVSQKGLASKTTKVTLNWHQLKSLLKVIYLPDFDYDMAKDASPKKPGKYLNTGEGLWFKFGEGLTEPDQKSNSLQRIEESLKALFK